MRKRKEIIKNLRSLTYQGKFLRVETKIFMSGGSQIPTLPNFLNNIFLLETKLTRKQRVTKLIRTGVHPYNKEKMA
jgi:hypothetical protein